MEDNTLLFPPAEFESAPNSPALSPREKEEEDVFLLPPPGQEDRFVLRPSRGEEEFVLRPSRGVEIVNADKKVIFDVRTEKYVTINPGQNLADFFGMARWHAHSKRQQAPTVEPSIEDLLSRMGGVAATTPLYELSAKLRQRSKAKSGRTPSIMCARILTLAQLLNQVEWDVSARRDRESATRRFTRDGMPSTFRDASLVERALEENKMTLKGLGSLQFVLTRTLGEMRDLVSAVQMNMGRPSVFFARNLSKENLELLRTFFMAEVNVPPSQEDCYGEKRPPLLGYLLRPREDSTGEVPLGGFSLSVEQPQRSSDGVRGIYDYDPAKGRTERDPANNAGICDGRYLCCGSPLGTVGCFIDTYSKTERGPTPYKIGLSPSEVGRMDASDHDVFAAEFRLRWLASVRRGTAWMVQEPYDAIHKRILSIMERVASKLAHAYHVYLTDPQGEDGLSFYRSLGADGCNDMVRLTLLVREYNRYLCRGGEKPTPQTVAEWIRYFDSHVFSPRDSSLTPLWYPLLDDPRLEFNVSPGKGEARTVFTLKTMFTLDTHRALGKATLEPNEPGLLVVMTEEERERIVKELEDAKNKSEEERQRLALEAEEKERQQRQREAAELAAKEAEVEKARAEREAEAKRLEEEQAKKAREDAEQLVLQQEAEKKKLEEEQAEAKRLAQPKGVAQTEEERLERERAEQERKQREQEAKERQAREQEEERQRLARQQQEEADRVAREKAEEERLAREKEEAARKAEEARVEEERLKREEEQARLDREREEQIRVQQEKENRERMAALEQARLDAEETERLRKEAEAKAVEAEKVRLAEIAHLRLEEEAEQRRLEVEQRRLEEEDKAARLLLEEEAEQHRLEAERRRQEEGNVPSTPPKGSLSPDSSTSPLSGPRENIPRVDTRELEILKSKLLRVTKATYWKGETFDYETFNREVLRPIVAVLSRRDQVTGNEMIFAEDATFLTPTMREALFEPHEFEFSENSQKMVYLERTLSEMCGVTQNGVLVSSWRPFLVDKSNPYPGLPQNPRDSDNNTLLIPQLSPGRDSKKLLREQSSRWVIFILRLMEINNDPIIHDPPFIVDRSVFLSLKYVGENGGEGTPQQMFSTPAAYFAHPPSLPHEEAKGTGIDIRERIHADELAYLQSGLIGVDISDDDLVLAPEKKRQDAKQILDKISERLRNLRNISFYTYRSDDGNVLFVDDRINTKLLRPAIYAYQEVLVYLGEQAVAEQNQGQNVRGIIHSMTEQELAHLGLARFDNIISPAVQRRLGLIKAKQFADGKDALYIGNGISTSASGGSTFYIGHMQPEEQDAFFVRWAALSDVLGAILANKEVTESMVNAVGESDAAVMPPSTYEETSSLIQSIFGTTSRNPGEDDGWTEWE